MPLHACFVQKERSGHDDHERAVEDQGQTRYPGNALCLWNNLFREDQHGQYGHRCDIHKAHRKEQHEEQPVRSQAREAMREAQAKGAGATVTPTLTQELLAQEVQLRGRQGLARQRFCVKFRQFACRCSQRKASRLSSSERSVFTTQILLMQVILIRKDVFVKTKWRMCSRRKRVFRKHMFLR